MKQNKYDENDFFIKYSQMERSIGGLESAGEWHILKTMFPSFQGKRVLDLGCGFGWHCRYASQQGASLVLGIDISQKMLARAKESTNEPKIKYKCMAIEDVNLLQEEFDVVMSSLAFHYVKDFREICEKIYNSLSNKGHFIFSVEHPMFTSNASQDWYYKDNGDILHWPIDNYQSEEVRVTRFLDEEVIKYHRTCASYINILIESGFSISKISEPVPSQEMIAQNQYLENELRRPMFLMISAQKI